MGVILNKEFDYLPGGFFVCAIDEERNLMYVNSEVLRLLCCKNMDEFVELTSGTFAGMVHPDDFEKVNALIGAGNRDEQMKFRNVEFRLKTLDGTVRYVNVYANADNIGNNIPLFYCFMADITVKTEENLDVLRRKDRYHDLYRKVRLSEDRFRFISSFAGVMFYEYDLTNKENSKFENSLDVLGYTEWDLQEVYRESETHDCLRFLMSDEDYAQIDEFYNEFKENGEAHTELRLRHKDGTYHWFSDNRCLMLSPNGDGSFIRGCLWNTDETHQVIASLQQSLKRDTMTGLLNKTSAFSVIEHLLEENCAQMCAFLFFDMDNFKLINDTFGHNIGDNIIRLMASELTRAFRENDVLGRFGGDKFFAFLPKITATAPVLEKVKSIITNLKNESDLEGTDFVLSTSVGVVFTKEDSAVSLFEKADKALYSAKLLGKGQFYVYDESTSVAIDDPYTMGLNERQEFLSHVEKFLSGAPASQKYALVSICVENFKLFNEWFGPRLGDKYIAELSYILRDFEMNNDCTVSYFGQDRFGVFMADERTLISELEGRLVALSKSISNTVAFLPALGVYRIRELSTSTNVMFECASEAMGYVFGDYNNRLNFYNPAKTASGEREKVLLMQIKDGLAKGEFVPYVQPKVDTETGRFLGCELISMWNHPERGLLDADAFIPTLEKYGLTPVLDRAMWEELFFHMQKWTQTYSDILLPVSINVTTSDLLSMDVCGTLDELIEKYKLKRVNVRVEVAESTRQEYEEKVDHEIARLRQGGYLVFMDNFSTDYSSFRRLRDMKVDVLKIDIDNFDIESEDFTLNKDLRILESIVHLAHSLDIPVIIEGISTKEEAEFLKQIHCRFAQGEYFYAPMPMESWEKILLEKPHLVDSKGIIGRFFTTQE